MCFCKYMKNMNCCRNAMQVFQKKKFVNQNIQLCIYFNEFQFSNNRINFCNCLLLIILVIQANRKVQKYLWHSGKRKRHNCVKLVQCVNNNFLFTNFGYIVAKPYICSLFILFNTFECSLQPNSLNTSQHQYQNSQKVIK